MSAPARTAAANSLPGSRRLAVGLLWATFAYNVVEGAVSVTAGVLAGSVALTGFGLDSFIEVVASSVLIWRLRLSERDKRVARREVLASRVIGVTFFVLVAVVLAQAAYVLATENAPEGTRLGIGVSVASLLIMPSLGLAKRWNAAPLNSVALLEESMETLACSYLSATLFIGLAANLAFGWWWADIVAALAMIPWLIHEGIEGVRAAEDEEHALASVD